MDKIGKSKFVSSVIFVGDISKSKNFYHKILDQKIEMDFGKNITFEGGLSLWDGNYAHEITGLNQPISGLWGKNNLEIYFETEELDKQFKKLKKEKIDFVHSIIEQPWGQRCFRVYDPDHHIVEFGEPMHIVVLRCHDNGMDVKEINKKTLMPINIINKIIGV